MNTLINGFKRVRKSRKPVEAFRVDYKPIFKIIRHQNGAATIAIRKWRIKIWGWWR